MHRMLKFRLQLKHSLKFLFTRLAIRSCIISLITIGLFTTGAAFAMSINEKIGQMIIVGFRGTDITSNSTLVNQIKDSKIGGVILYDIDFEKLVDYAKENNLSVLDARNLAKIDENNEIRYERNVKNPAQVQKLTADIQAIAAKAEKLPVLITIDYEGGIVNRLPTDLGFPKTFSQKELSNKPGMEIESIANQYVHTLKQNGINYVFGPVVDLEINPNNPVIAKLKRSFSPNPAIVTKCANILISAYKRANIACALKHFPGHGSSLNHSHLGFTDITDTWQPQELEPYKNLLANYNHIGATVMPGHVVNKNLDNDGTPATLSQKTLNILRQDINFNGIVVSDDLQMKGITDHYDLETTIKLAILAGNDLLLFSNQLTYDEQIADKVNNIIQNLVKKGEISEERIEQSFVKIEELKQWIS